MNYDELSDEELLNQLEITQKGIAEFDNLQGALKVVL